MPGVFYVEAPGFLVPFYSVMLTVCALGEGGALLGRVVHGVCHTGGMIRALMMILPPLLAIGFAVYALIDAARSDAERVRNLPKGAWITLIVLFNVVGSAAWFIAGRPKGQSVPKLTGLGKREPELPARGAAPDDDEEYLRWLEQQAKRKRDSSESDSDSSPSVSEKSTDSDSSPESGTPDEDNPKPSQS